MLGFVRFALAEKISPWSLSTTAQDVSPPPFDAHSGLFRLLLVVLNVDKRELCRHYTSHPAPRRGLCECMVGRIICWL